MKISDIQLLIPMSGIGKRFLEAGYKVPKPLIVVDGKPMVQHVVELFPGIEDITFICNENHLAETNMKDVITSFIHNPKILNVKRGLRGPVEVISKIYESIDDNKPVIISYCDYGTKWNFQNFLKEVEKYDGGIACYKGFHPHMLGSDNYAFLKEKDGILIDIKEKEPFTDNKMNEYASNGTYYFHSGSIMKKYFSLLINSNQTVNGEFYVSLVYKLMAEDNLKTKIFEIEKMLQWGTPKDLEIFNDWLNYFSKKNRTIKSKNPANTTLILPMAGRGDRFKKEGYSVSKPFIEVDDQPMVVRAVNCLPKSDNEVFICLKEHVENNDAINVLKSNNRSIITLDSTTQGQACTCQIAIEKANLSLENPIMISACDNGVLFDHEKYEKLVNDENIDVIVWSFRKNYASKLNPSAYAWLDVDNDGNINNVLCKKEPQGDPLEKHAIIGTMFFRKAEYFVSGLSENISKNIRVNNEFYVDDVINRCIEKGLNVKVFEAENYICWGTPNDYKTYKYWQEYFGSRNS